ncbi:unnamed protein product [Paramecium sonneborni]|uniref:Uncharacterized protein n=1 Tax=Paramecium sonneborni TaxID=65129 RepID=A0A8S1QU30_9CILI|nr:unnamed protein product [Paramecium sonneborni]
MGTSTNDRKYLQRIPKYRIQNIKREQNIQDVLIKKNIIKQQSILLRSENRRQRYIKQFLFIERDDRKVQYENKHKQMCILIQRRSRELEMTGCQKTETYKYLGVWLNMRDTCLLTKIVWSTKRIKHRNNGKDIRSILYYGGLACYLQEQWIIMLQRKFDEIYTKSVKRLREESLRIQRSRNDEWVIVRAQTNLTKKYDEGSLLRYKHSWKSRIYKKGRIIQKSQGYKIDKITYQSRRK